MGSPSRLQTIPVKIPEVSLEFLESDKEGIWFQLQADPEPTRDLAVLLNFNSDGETFHIWQAIPKGSGTIEFSVEFDKYVSWDVEILNLEGRDLNHYPVEDFGLSTEDRFIKYALGNPSRVRTIPDREGKMYWTDSGTAKIQRANLDGSNIQDLVTSSDGLERPQGIALDVIGGKMYWTDDDTEKIQRANLNGFNIQDLVTSSDSLFYLNGIALDVIGGKMYWTDRATIRRANLNGSNIQDLVTSSDELEQPQGIALDVAGGKVYWTNTYWKKANEVKRINAKIRRANLDGSNVQDLVTHSDGLEAPQGIELDVIGGKMYWTDNGTAKIRRANLDGSNIQDLVTHSDGLEAPRGIELDVIGGKMYWVDWSTEKIQRANLDGSNIQDLVTRSDGLEAPRGIALDVD